jgi:hypothetical protein
MLLITEELPALNRDQSLVIRDSLITSIVKAEYCLTVIFAAEH